VVRRGQRRREGGEGGGDGGEGGGGGGESEDVPSAAILGFLKVDVGDEVGEVVEFREGGLDTKISGKGRVGSGRIISDVRKVCSG
jgi:hypothetical protein